MRGLFVTGTGTGVGKTIVSACLLAAMRAAGEPVRAYKPVVTGLEEQPSDGLGERSGDRLAAQPGKRLEERSSDRLAAQPGKRLQERSRGWPADHELLGLAAGMDPNEVAPLRYGPAVSPHLAAALAGEPIDPAALVARAREHPDRTLVVEGVGGLLVPLTNDYAVRDLALELALPLVVAAAPGLGTINHTLLTVEAARAAGLDVRAVVLTPWPAEPSTLERSNRETIERLAAPAGTATLACVERPDVGALAAAGSTLGWRSWLTG